MPIRSRQTQPIGTKLGLVILTGPLADLAVPLFRSRRFNAVVGKQRRFGQYPGLYR